MIFQKVNTAKVEKYLGFPVPGKLVSCMKEGDRYLISSTGKVYFQYGGHFRFTSALGTEAWVSGDIILPEVSVVTLDSSYFDDSVEESVVYSILSRFA